MARKIGYARVSNEDQQLNMQIDALKAYGVEERDIFCEKMTGSRKDRPELDRLLKYVQPGDSVVIWKLDRIGRSVKHLIQLMDEFKERGIELVSLKDSIDTKTSAGKLLFTIMAALAEFERDIIVERTNKGLKAARARGRKGGRPFKSPDKVELAIAMHESQKFSIAEIEKQTGVSKATLYRYLKQSKNTTA